MACFLYFKNRTKHKRYTNSCQPPQRRQSKGEIKVMRRLAEKFWHLTHLLCGGPSRTAIRLVLRSSSPIHGIFAQLRAVAGGRNWPWLTQTIVVLCSLIWKGGSRPPNFQLSVQTSFIWIWIYVLHTLRKNLGVCVHYISWFFRIIPTRSTRTGEHGFPPLPFFKNFFPCKKKKRKEKKERKSVGSFEHTTAAAAVD